MVRAHYWSLLAGSVLLGGCIGGAPPISSIKTPPTVLISTPSEGTSFMQAEPIVFEGLAQSMKYTPDLLLHTWTTGAVTMCETSAVATDGAATCNWTFQDFGEHTITVSVTDPDSEFAEDTVTIVIIENTPPTIEVQEPVADGVYPVDEPVDVTVVVDDVEDGSGDLELVVLNSYTDSTGATVEETLTDLDTDVPDDGKVSTSTDMLQPGVNELTFTVTDLLGSYASETFMITLNQPPTAPVVAIEPDPAIAQEGLTAVIAQESEDPDGDAVSYDYVWAIDGVDVGSPLTKNTMDAGLTQRGETVRVTVTPYDVHGAYGEEFFTEIVIGNALPSVATCELQPSSPTSSEELTAVGGGWLDADGDPETYTYNWLYKDGGNGGMRTAAPGSKAAQR